MSAVLWPLRESPSPTPKADLSFVCEQASRYVRARPWQRLSHASTYGEMDGVLAAILVGKNDTYVLAEVQEHREELMLWRHVLTSSVGIYAVSVSADETLEAIFECGSAPD